MVRRFYVFSWNKFSRKCHKIAKPRKLISRKKLFQLKYIAYQCLKKLTRRTDSKTHVIRSLMESRKLFELYGFFEFLSCSTLLNESCEITGTTWLWIYVQISAFFFFYYFIKFCFRSHHWIHRTRRRRNIPTSIQINIIFLTDRYLMMIHGLPDSYGILSDICSSLFRRLSPSVWFDRQTSTRKKVGLSFYLCCDDTWFFWNFILQNSF